jgi:tetratricopeptide (TPR) repeat protein
MTTAAVAKASMEIEDPIERAAFLASKLDAVAKPAALVRPWFDASLAKPGRRELTAETAVAMARARPNDWAFLDAVGNDLARRNFNNEAIEVYRMALTAGSTTDTTGMLLGYLLLRQGNVEGIALLVKSLEGDAEWSLPRETLGRYFAEHDPARALTLLSTPQSGEEHDLRAMALWSLGRTAAANREARDALDMYADDFEAHWKLAEWHTRNDGHERALLHARELLALLERGVTLSDEDRDSVDEAIVEAFSDGGAIAELLPWLRARTTPFTMRTAWHVHFGLDHLHPNPDPELTMRAARDLVAHHHETGDASQARVWAVREAGVAAKHGNVAPLEALVASGLDDDADAWLEVASCYMASDDYDAATAAADRALLLDPSSGGALVVMCRLAMSLGDADMLHRVSMALLVAKPAWHEGPEFLARSFARRFDSTAALMHSQRTIEMAAYCHNAWLARAEALLVSGDLEGARTCTDRALAIRAGEPGDTSLLLAAALRGDTAKLEAELAYGYRHLPAPAFPDYVARLREVASSVPA